MRHFVDYANIIINECSKVIFVISGDIAIYGTEDQYNIAYQWLTDCENFWKKETRILQSFDYVVVPGNHDCMLSDSNPIRDLVIKEILKKDKTSEYVNDANEIISIMEKLVDCIEDEGTVQLFVTRANVLSMNLDNLAEKYANQPEGNYLSFKKMMQVNGYVKSISQLRKEAQIYQRYLAYQTTGSIYNPENINEQLQYLLNELNTTIVMLKAEKE